MNLSLIASGAELKIDHVTLAGSSLDEMRRAFTAATRIPTEYGGKHSNHATEMALASFADGSYLELIGIPNDADPAAVDAHVWSKFLRADAGPCAFAIRVPDIAAEIRRFTSAGIRAGDIEKSGRTRPDGIALSWETADAGPGPRGTLLPFLIHDFTPRENRAYPSGKPTSNLPGVGLVVIGVRDLSAAVALYRKAFQLPEPHRQRDESVGAELAWFEGSPVALAAPLASDSWLAKRVARFGDSPCAFLLKPAGGMLGSNVSSWFGHKVFWFDRGQFDWRLGFWT